MLSAREHLITYLTTKNRHVPVFVVVLEVCIFCTYGGAINILRQTNLSKQVSSDFFVSMLRIFTVSAMKRFKDCNTKMDHEELLSIIMHLHEGPSLYLSIF